MKPLDNVKMRESQILDPDYTKVLFPEEAAILNGMTDSEKQKYIRALLCEPVLFENPEIIYNWHFRNKWDDAVKAVHNGRNVKVLEVGAGCCDMIPKTLARLYSGSETKYTTMNLNKELTAEFKRKVHGLNISIDVIEDDAKNIAEYTNEAEANEAFDIIAFEHSANDVIETIIAEKNGIDTINSNWLQILPPITEIVNDAFRNGAFEELVKIEFLQLISACTDVLRPGGCLIFAHYPFQYNLDIGLIPEFNEFLLPAVSKWITEAGLGKEITVEGFDSPWWLFIKI